MFLLVCVGCRLNTNRGERLNVLYSVVILELRQREGIFSLNTSKYQSFHEGSKGFTRHVEEYLIIVVKTNNFLPKPSHKEETLRGIIKCDEDFIYRETLLVRLKMKRKFAEKVKFKFL